MPAALPPEERSSRQCQIWLPAKVVKEIDILAAEKLLPRSSYMRLMVLEHLKRERRASIKDTQKPVSQGPHNEG